MNEINRWCGLPFADGERQMVQTSMKNIEERFSEMLPRKLQYYELDKNLCQDELQNTELWMDAQSAL